MEDYAESMKRLPIVELIREMARIKKDLEKAKKAKTDFQKQFDIIRLNILPDKMEEEGISTTTLSDVGRVSLSSDLYFSIPAEKRDDAYKWLRNHGHGDIIKETVNSSIGKKFAKEMLLAGETLPDTIFKVTPFTRASLTKVK